MSAGVPVRVAGAIQRDRFSDCGEVGDAFSGDGKGRQ